MADWFKFYDNGMDEPRFRYALRTLSEVCPVWLLTLSECCRHRSDTFAWTGDEVDLIGWSEKACTTPPKVNEAMKILAKIRYIELGDGFIKVLNWNKLQSEYCRKSSRTTPDSDRTLTGQTPDSVGHSPLEERRGEEIRVEDKRVEHVPERNGVCDELKIRFKRMFEREQRGLNLDEAAAIEQLARRPNALVEFSEIACFRNTIPPGKLARSFPQSLTVLLSKWDELLDRSKVPPAETEKRRESSSHSSHSITNL